MPSDLLALHLTVSKEQYRLAGPLLLSKKYNILKFDTGRAVSFSGEQIKSKAYDKYTSRLKNIN
jgi:hypothetical protein